MKLNKKDELLLPSHRIQHTYLDVVHNNILYS